MQPTRREFLAAAGAMALAGATSRALAFPPGLPTPGAMGGELDFMFEHGEPLYNHPLWSLANTVPCVRIDCRYEYTSTGDFTFNPATSPIQTANATLRVLKRYESRFAPLYQRAGKKFRWIGMPAGFGGAYPNDEYPNVRGLLNNTQDRLESGLRAPWAQHGISWNREWTTAFAQHLSQQLIINGYIFPEAYILTSENGVGDDYGGHFDVNGGDQGWVPQALEDARSSSPDHTIDGELTFAEYFSRATTIAGGEVPRYNHTFLGGPPGRNPRNFESSERYQGAIRRLWDFSRCKGFVEPLQQFFPGLPVAEYQAAADSKKFPNRARPLSLLHQTDGIFNTPWQSPDYYGGGPFVYTDPDQVAMLNADHPGWDTNENYLRIFPNNITNPADKLFRLGLDLAKARLLNHSRASRKPIVPYIASEPTTNPIWMLEYIRFAQSLGVRKFMVFMPEGNGYAEKHTWWYNLITSANMLLPR